MWLAVVIGFFVLMSLIDLASRRAEAKRAEEYRKQASLRGWHLERDGRQLHYSGTTEGIPWTLVTAMQRNRGGDEKRWPIRWKTDAVRSDQTLVVWPVDRSEVMVRTDVPDFVRNAAFAMLGKALGVPGPELVNAKESPELAAVLDDTPIVGVVLWREGLVLVTPIVVETPESVGKIVALGVRLSRAGRTMNAEG
jgi:hypothetical protein